MELQVEKCGEKGKTKMSKIHPNAIVHPNAQIGDNVEIGPFSIVEENVVIGDGTQIGSSCVIEGYTTMGKNNRVFPGAIVGSIPQDLKYKGDKTYLIIGDNNIIREYVTINPGTEEGTKTIIGNNNEFMASVHIAHDCILGNNIIIANLGTLAGHVELEDRAIVGGLTAIHQFVKVGKMAIIGGCSKVTQDIPPFSMSDGHPAIIRAINNIGLIRQGIDQPRRMAVKKAMRFLFKRDYSLSHVISLIENEMVPITEEVQYLLDFLKATGRGIAR